VAFDGNTTVITSRNMKFAADQVNYQNLGLDGNFEAFLDPGSLFENLGPGDVYVYERDGRGAWSLVTLIQPSDLAEEGWGLSAAIDGDVIVLGVPDNWKNSIYYEEKILGYVYVYRRHGDSWTEEAQLTPPSNSETKFLSGSVSVRGGTIAVGDYYGNRSAGAVFVYEFDPLSKSWNPVDGALVNLSCSKYFGSVVMLTNEEEMLVS